MVFSSLTFLLYFLPITCILYFTARSITQKNIILLIVSLFFYAWGEPVYIFVIVLSLLNDYFFSNQIQRLRDKSANKKYLERIYFLVSLAINLGLLMFFKYSNFIIENVNYLLDLNIQASNLPLPIGISFYTFQTMSYSIDVYRAKLKAQRNFITLATYVALFPQLIAGPIVRYETIEQELTVRTSNSTDIAYGIRRFIVGLAKKVLIANQMGLIADAIFKTGATANYTLVVWLGVVAYSFQIYFDFSGYSDMAIALGRMFGFHFLENFNYPYIASSITDFWRRWHISLSSWFKDYVYIPLGGNRKLQYRNIFIVWFLTGLWHGASWNFIIWGLYYAYLLIIEKLLKGKITLPYVLKRAITMFLVFVGWTIFRVENFTDLKAVFTTMFTYKHISISLFLLEYQSILYALPFIIVAIIASVPLFKKLALKLEHKKITAYLLDFYLIVVFLITMSFLVGSSFNPFIYFRF